MSMPSPFHVAQQIGNNLAGAFRESRDNNAIETILSQAQASGNPEVMQNAIGQILSKVSPERQPMAVQYLQNTYKNMQEKQIKQRQNLAAQQIGVDPDLPESLQRIQLQKSNNKQIGSQIYDSILQAGYPESTAKLWQTQYEGAPIGGQSDVVKQVDDLLRRTDTGKGLKEGTTLAQLKPTIEIPGIETPSFELNFPELRQSIGRTSADLVKEEEKHKDVNTPLYSETVDKLNALDEEYRDIALLQEYNEIPEALPSGIEKWNVNWDTGDLRFKALANPETQAYVKTIARMARNAKDFFPGRVTNFDLDQFKAGFPTLANSKEGRKLISEQLALANRIAYLKDETLKAAIDHYGSGADPVQIRKHAQENYRKLKGILENDLKKINAKSDQIIKNESNKQPKIEEAQTLEDLFP